MLRNELTEFKNELDPIVFGAGVLVALVAVGALVTMPETSKRAIDASFAFLTTNFGWFYLLVMFVLVLFALFLVLGPWGNIKIGKEDDEPEFSYRAYFAMLYSAGIAAGIVFWGPAEGITHYDTVPPLIGAEAGTPEAAVGAVQYSFFHWGLSAWSAYVLLALPIAFYAYRYDAPMRVSTILAPFIGLDNLDGFWAKLVDILAVFATIGGIATTLGFVGSQFLTGLEYSWGIQLGDAGTILVITGLTIAFTLSVAVGVNRGIRRVSNFNMGLFFVLLVAAFLLGPTRYIVTVGAEALGRYANQFVQMSLYTNAAGAGATGWVGTWTVFYWSWWFAWTPFVGLFIARVSKGRTVRQAVGTGVIASTAVTIPWFATMGGTAIRLQSTGRADIVAALDQFGAAGAGYPMFDALLFGGVLTILFLVLITTFFVTSADSSTLALGMITTGGKQRPSTVNRVIWGAFMGALASLLIVTGGTGALQTASVITGGPFAVVTLVAVASLIVTFGDIRPVFLETQEHTSVPEPEPGAVAAEDDD